MSTTGFPAPSEATEPTLRIGRHRAPIGWEYRAINREI